MNSTTKCNFEQLGKEAKDVLVSKASRPPSQSSHDHQHLSQTERYQIYILMKDGKTQSQIAQLLNRHKSTISRELARNTGNRGYRPKQAAY